MEVLVEHKEVAENVKVVLVYILMSSQHFFISMFEKVVDFLFK